MASRGGFDPRRRYKMSHRTPIRAVGMSVAYIFLQTAPLAAGKETKRRTAESEIRVGTAPFCGCPRTDKNYENCSSIASKQATHNPAHAGFFLLTGLYLQVGVASYQGSIVVV